MILYQGRAPLSHMMLCPLALQKVHDMVQWHNIACALMSPSRHSFGYREANHANVPNCYGLKETNTMQHLPFSSSSPIGLYVKDSKHFLYKMALTSHKSN